jgi:hypothetical protein
MNPEPRAHLFARLWRTGLLHTEPKRLQPEKAIALSAVAPTLQLAIGQLAICKILASAVGAEQIKCHENPQLAVDLYAKTLSFLFAIG